MIACVPGGVNRGNGESGFTLVEVLAALALSSLLLVSLNLSITTVRQGVERTRLAMGSQAAISAAAQVFVRDVARIARIRLDGEAGYLFAGNARQMIYPLSERRGAAQGDLFLVRLRVREAEGLTQLIRERSPVPPGDVTNAAGASWGDAVVLLEGPFDIGLAYRAQRSGDRRWAESWSGTEAMPEQVRLTLADRRTGRLRIPVLVQSLEIDAEVQCAADPGACGRPKPEGAAP